MLGLVSVQARGTRSDPCAPAGMSRPRRYPDEGERATPSSIMGNAAVLGWEQGPRAKRSPNEGAAGCPHLLAGSGGEPVGFALMSMGKHSRARSR